MSLNPNTDKNKTSDVVSLRMFKLMMGYLSILFFREKLTEEKEFVIVGDLSELQAAKPEEEANDKYEDTGRTGLAGN